VLNLSDIIFLRTATHAQLSQRWDEYFRMIDFIEKVKSPIERSWSCTVHTKHRCNPVVPNLF